MKPELIFYSGASLLEGPCWDPLYEVLYCVSIEQKIIYRINPENGFVNSYQTESEVGCAVIDDKGMILEAETNGIYRLNPDNGKREFLIQAIQEPDMRYNDGKFDPAGRFLVGTKGLTKDHPGLGKLYSFDGCTTTTIITGTTISNGLGFSSDQKWMYFIDTPTRKIGRYKYDINTGKALFDKYVVEITDGGLPDGMCVDAADMIWVAEWGGSKVSHWNPDTGIKTDEINLPCINISSCCIGGKNNELLFITTAKSDFDEFLAGGLFAVRIK